MNGTRRAFVGALATAVPAVGRASSKTGLAAGARFYVAALTPLDRSGRLDQTLARDLLAFLRERGADGVVVLGTTGEFSSFSLRERKQILEAYLPAKGSLEVICQAGTPNLPETLELLEHAAGTGAHAALVVPPFYYKNPAIEGLVRYYAQVLDAARIPVLLYHIPGLSGVPVSSELLQRLEKHPRLYGVKDSSGNLEGTAAFIREFPKLKIFTGSSGHIETALKLGGAGAITGDGNVLTRETAAVFRQFRQGAEVSAAQAKLDEASKLLRGLLGIPGMKSALASMGLRESYCRPPLVEMSDERQAELKAKLAMLNRDPA